MTSPRLREWMMAAAIVIAALLLRTWDLGARPLWLDESWSRWMAEQDWPQLFASVRTYDTHPSLYYSLLKLWQGLAPWTPLGLRSLSVLAGLAMLPLAWLCARRIGRQPEWAVWLVTAGVAASPALIVAARQARPYALFALAFALALWAALGLLRSAEATRRHRALWWCGYGVALELVLWLHGLGALFAASLSGGLFLALAVQDRLRSAFLPFLFVNALAAVAWLPCFAVIMQQRRAWTHTWLRFDWADVPAGLAGGLAAPGATGLFLILLALLGGSALLRRVADRPAAIMLLASAFLPALFTIALSLASSPIFLPRTLVPSAFPLLLLAVAALPQLTRPVPRVATAGAALSLLAACSMAQVVRPPEEQWSRLVVWLDQRVGDDEEVWLLPNELVLPMRYAGARSADRVRGIPANFPAPDHRAPRYSGTMAVPGMTAEDAGRLVREARRRGRSGVWIVSRFPALFDPGATVGQAMGHAPIERSAEFAPILIEHYRLARAATRPRG